jgi:hypothetical protein
VGALRWSETLAGWLSPQQTDFNQALLEGRRERATLNAKLALEIADLDEFVVSSSRRVKVLEGSVECAQLGGELTIPKGEFELLVPCSELFDQLHRRMRYRLDLAHENGRKLNLYGFKMIEHDRGSDMWSDSTTLFVRVHEGWDSQIAESRTRQRRTDGARADGEVLSEDSAEQAGEGGQASPAQGEETLVASGILFISPTAFLRQLTTFTGSPSDVLRFFALFAEGLVKTYAGRPNPHGRKSFPVDRPPEPWARADPEWQAVPGREDEDPPAKRYALTREIIPFAVDDLPFALNLHHIRRAEPRARDGSRGPVLLVPGSGVRAELYYGQPVGETLVDRLLQERYDVWVENWRSSIDLPTNSYTLDQAARFDHPQAIETVLAHTGAERLGAVVHCQGSISFLMAALAGYLPEGTVSNVVSSAISLFFKIPSATWLKQRTVLQVARRVGKGSDAQWGIRAPTPISRLIVEFARLTERPCGNGPCQVANYMYGSGWDVLLLHDNVDDEVHAWSARELGYTPFSLIEQVAESCRHGHIVRARGDHHAPPSYIEAEPQIKDTRFMFIAGTHNRMFDAEGQQRSAEYLRKFGLEADFVPLPGYGHLDTFWGRNSAEDVWPKILAGLQAPPRGALPPDVLGAPLGRERARRYGVLRPDRRSPRPLFTRPPVARRRPAAPGAGQRKRRTRARTPGASRG